MGTSSGSHFHQQPSPKMLPPRQQPRGLQTSLSLVSPDACGSPNLQERGSNSDQVRESPSESASSRETWPTADALIAKKLEKEKEGENGFAEHSVIRHISSSDKMSLRDVARERVDIISERMQHLPDEFLEKLKTEIRVILEGTGGSLHRDEFLSLQKLVQSRSDLTDKTLIRAHRVQLEILVAIKTGIQAFLHPSVSLSQASLIEVFLYKRCRNIACGSPLPAEDCNCEACSMRNGFCNLCMCVICNKFDFEVNTCRWIGCDSCSHWTHTDCAIRNGLIGPGPGVKTGSVPADMLFGCRACNRTSELLGWVKDVFQQCAPSWDREALIRELDYVSRIFRGSEDPRGRKLVWKCDELIDKLKGGMAEPAVACKVILLFFQELEVDPSKNSESEEGGQLIAPQEAFNRIANVVQEAIKKMEMVQDSSLSSLMADSVSPILVKLARHENNPNIMLLAIRAITYLCDVHPRSSGFLVRHDAVPALCQRLIAIEYLDVAEQCLQALEKISHDQPLACLQSGAIMAVLTYIDFFSTSVQRVALSTVVNICKKLPSECPSTFMEAVPMLCKLLQYEDPQLVENVATCLIKIAERVQNSPDMLDELCNHGLIQQATHLIDLNCRTTLCQPVYTGLIGLLVKLASGSIVAFRTLFELNISSILKDVLSTYNLSHGMPSSNMVDGSCNQVHEVLKLLNELLPAIARDHSISVNLEKENFLVNQPDHLQKFGMDLLSILIQVVNSGANLYVCYGSLSVINKFIYFSKSEMLIELLKDTNISSFLAGVFTRKDNHVLMLALQIADTILQKLSDIFLNSFLKEGVFFAIDTLSTPEKGSQLMFPMFSGIQQSNDTSQNCAARDAHKCLCYAFDTSQSAFASETGSCRLEKDSVHSLAKQIKTNYFDTKILNHEPGLTDILQKLRTLAAALTDLVNTSMSKDSPRLHEEFYSILHQIMAQLNGRDPISTFEFIESGIVKALVNYLSNGQYLRENTELSGGFNHTCGVEKRFEVFGRLFLPSLDAPLEDFPLSILTQKLQTALSSLENFPVILSHSNKQRNSFATVPYGRCTSHPCLKVQFMRGEGETRLCDYSDVLTVDPFSSLDAIERYLWPKVSKNRTEHGKSAATRALSRLESLPSQLPSDMSSPGGKIPDLMESDSMSSDMQAMQEDKPNISHSLPEEGDNSRQTTGETTGSSEVPIDVVQDHVENKQHNSSAVDTSMITEYSGSSSNEDTSPKLLFYLEGHQLDQALSLYQAILQQQIKAEHDTVNFAKLWSQVYRVTYRRAVKPGQSCSQDSQHQAHDSSMSDRVGTYWQCTPFFSDMFVSKLASDLETSNPVYDVLFFLKSLEGMNRFRFHLMSNERMYAFAEGRIDNLDNLKVTASAVPQNEFVSSKLTEKLEQQMRDPLAMSIGGMPLWCSKLMTSCPFLLAFEARCKYFRLAAFGQLQAQPHPTSHNDSGGLNGRRQNASGLPRKKFLVCRDRILESATQMMNLYARQKAILEVEYNEEVGTGLGPTLEFYTLVSHEFQKSGLGMWREDHRLLLPTTSLQMEDEDSRIVVSPCGLFPHPWSSTVSTSGGMEFSEVISKFVLLGQVIAKSVQDGRVLDIPFSKAFYKLILGQELTVYDIHSFDPELSRALLEFQAVVERKRYLESVCGENSALKLNLCFRNTTIEDLSLDFSLPGYPDYILTSGPDPKMVNMTNLEEYVSLIVDATINAGVCRQMEAFKSGFNQVFPIKHLQVFSEEELERLLCGEREFWTSNELLDHIKFDHGYTSSSPPILNLLEIIREFNQELQRAFLQFVTGAPRLPPGGLASLNPKLTIVRKHSSQCADADLPSVMTCANYLKMPPYSSKETMKEKLLYAITEGQGSFHLS